MEGADAEQPTVGSITKSQLTSLAPELKCAIFQNLPDVTSAKSLALISSSFYHTFLDAQSVLLTQVLQNEITTNLLHGAFAASKASRIPLWTKQAVRGFLDEYFGDFNPHKSQKWKLSEALHMSRVHSCVEFFAAEFASAALSRNPTARGSNAAPSAAEMIRIKRILYRFELYCNLFRKPHHDRMIRGERNCLIQPSPFEKEEQRDVFLDMFSPWENEQLGCIHDHLIEQITVPFNDVAKHDVDWGELEIEWVEPFGDKEIFYKEGYLLKGLEFIFQLSITSAYDDRHRLLMSNQGSGGFHLSEALTPSRSLQQDGIPLEEYTDEEERMYVNSSFDNDDDDDIGPAEAWRWAHARNTKDRFYYLKSHRSLRQGGYVMWDFKRHLDWGLLEKPVGDILVSLRPGHLRRVAEQQEQTESFEERLRIWEKGGRGWWAPGDESHIQWPSDRRKLQDSGADV